ncbi:GH3 auxin-responsive promoter family protein, partial [bacterium]|nr:GH3 auxin-responsive promoter family protein [bacterium]
MNELLNRIWRQSCRKEARKFQLAIREPLASQTETLMRQLRVLAPSHWGNHWRLNSTNSVEEFQKRVPITRYEDYRIAIA